ncbi:hypothetical protein TorRG33x02_296910 [Trema orientale]|uniref:Uncharacterized protein n=1 Tax=Trema orientale TaxID=63057 RepID=A0A2P5C5K2_TREOI|nr:hypothetical protein TorRG33x02_296910 [Trema orientale]
MTVRVGPYKHAVRGARFFDSLYPMWPKRMSYGHKRRSQNECRSGSCLGGPTPESHSRQGSILAVTVGLSLLFSS